MAVSRAAVRQPPNPDIERRTRQWVEHLAAEARLGPVRWELQQRRVLRRPPLHHLVERISVPLEDVQGAVCLVRKHVDISDWASALIGDTLLREAAWYATHSQQSITTLLEHPCLEVLWQGKDRACLLLRDVRTDLVRWQAAGEAGMAQALRALATLHASFSQDDRRAALSWLPQYERFFITTFAQHRAAAIGGLDRIPGGQALLSGAPDFGMGVTAWLQALPSSVREKVQRLWCEPRVIFERLSSIPHTVIHGDPGPQHFGLRYERRGPKVVLIDWEFVARGPALLDLVHVLFFRQFDSIPARACFDRALERYLAFSLDRSQCGRAREDWKMAFDLSAMLWVLAYGQRHGQVLCRVAPARRQQHPAWSALQDEARLFEEAYIRWLR